MNYLEELEDNIAYSKLNKGEETGAVSKILSGISLLLVATLLVILVKNGLYIPAIILLALGFTRFGQYATIGLLVYLIIVQFWLGVVIMAIFGAVGWFSVTYGLKNIKKDMYSGKAKVSALEGMTDLILIWIIQIIFLVLALLLSGGWATLFWILFTIVTLFEALRYYNRLSSPWRQLHFPLMFRYAGIAGYQMGVAKRENKEFNLDVALNAFVKNIYPKWTDGEVEDFLKSVEKKKDKFADRDSLFNAFKKTNPTIDETKLKNLLDKVEEHFKKEGPRMIIAEIVERDYGTEERVKYLQAVIKGSAT